MNTKAQESSSTEHPEEWLNSPERIAASKAWLTGLQKEATKGPVSTVWVINRLELIDNMLGCDEKQEAADEVINLYKNGIDIRSWFGERVSNRYYLILAVMRERMSHFYGAQNSYSRQSLVKHYNDAIKDMVMSGPPAGESFVEALDTAKACLDYRTNQTGKVWLQKYTNGAISIHRSEDDLKAYSEVESGLVLGEPEPITSTKHTNQIIGWSNGCDITADMLENT